MYVGAELCRLFDSNVRPNWIIIEQCPNQSIREPIVIIISVVVDIGNLLLSISNFVIFISAISHVRRDTESELRKRERQTLSSLWPAIILISQYPWFGWRF